MPRETETLEQVAERALDLGYTSSVTIERPGVWWATVRETNPDDPATAREASTYNRTPEAAVRYALGLLEGDR